MFKLSNKILKLVCLSTILISSIGIGLYMYLYYTEVNNQVNIQLNLKGVLNQDLIFLDLNNNKISYDTVKPSSNNKTFLLNRFFTLNSEFIMVEALLDSNYKQISNWEYLETNLNTNNVLVSKDGNTLNIDISNIMFDIIYYNNIPSKINEYEIVKYNNTGGKINDTVYFYLQNIKDPIQDELFKQNIIYTTSIIPDNIDLKCFIDLSYKAMESGNNLVSVGKCSGYNTVGIPGTNFKNIKDIVADIDGAVHDNYKSGFDNLKNFDNKQYDFCTGYSLGGAIAKYMSLNNYCKNIITFASPLTMKYNMEIPITQYINTMDDMDGCCKRDWIGNCIKKGMFLVDPVTLILKGNHENVKYIGKRQNNECIGNFAYTVWKQGFNLHANYEDNF